MASKVFATGSVAAALAWLLQPVVSRAHHSGAAYDISRQVQIVGTIKEFCWANPHVWSRSVLAAGDRITVVVNPVRTGEWSGRS